MNTLTPPSIRLPAAMASTPSIQSQRPARVVAISQALREAARQVRAPTTRWLPTLPARDRWKASFALGVVISFLTIVVLPALGSGGYLALIASDQYASEVRFAVRGSNQSALASLGSMFGISSSDHVQDSLILVNYLRSRGIVEDIDQSLGLRKMYTRPDTDFISRFTISDPIEYLVRYWNNHVDVTFDNLSGVITVVIRAFTPQDSLEIAKQVIGRSETLINDLSERARRDALRMAQGELNRAETNLQSKVRTMRDLRDTEKVLDADKTAEMMTKMSGELRLQQLNLEQDYAALVRSVTKDSPQARVLQAQITSIKDQIAQIESEMTKTERGGGTILSESIGRFDREKLEQDIAQKQYVAAALTFERARVDVETQQIYLATFLQPVLAQDALFPKRWWLWSIILTSCLALWGAGVGTAVLVRNYGTG